MSGVLTIVLATALALTYATLVRSAISTQQDKLRRAAHQIARVAEAGLRQSRARYLTVALDPAVLAALDGKRAAGRTGADSAGAAAVRDLLSRLGTPNDSGLPIELWSADGRRVAFIGNDVRSAVRARAGRPEVPEPPIPHQGLDGIRLVDSLQLGQLYEDGGRTYYWSVFPILDQQTPIGYIARQQRISNGRQTATTLQELSGDSVSAYFHTVDGSYWSDISGAPASATSSSTSPRTRRTGPSRPTRRPSR